MSDIKLLELNAPEVIPPKAAPPVGNAVKDDPNKKVSTEKSVDEIKKADEAFLALAKAKGYKKVDQPESKAIMMWKSSLIGLAVMLIGFFAKFLVTCYAPATDSMVWSMGALIDMIYNSLMAITGVGFFSKMKKYYDVSAESTV
jgi:hypothetical protein